MNKFKKLDIAIGIVILSVLIAGCASFGVRGKDTKKLEKQTDKIDAIAEQQTENDKSKMEQVSFFSAGVDYSLRKITNQVEPEVIVAKDLNSRILSLAGNPSLEEQQSVWKMVDDLVADNKNGKIKLQERDLIISQLQNNTKKLEKKKDEEVKKALDLASTIASKSDANQAQIDDLKGHWGLNAIWFGIKTFVTRIIWSITIFSVLFLILRLLASSNPIASAIFTVFEQIGSWFIHAIVLLLPKAATIAGHVTTQVYNTTANALKSVVDSVETVKLQSDASGVPATIQDLLETASLSMTPEDKLLIEKIKIDMGWVKKTPTSTVIIKTVTPTPPVVTPTAPITLITTQTIATPVVTPTPTIT